MAIPSRLHQRVRLTTRPDVLRTGRPSEFGCSRPSARSQRPESSPQVGARWYLRLTLSRWPGLAAPPMRSRHWNLRLRAFTGPADRVACRPRRSAGVHQAEALVACAKLRDGGAGRTPAPVALPLSRLLYRAARVSRTATSARTFHSARRCLALLRGPARDGRSRSRL